MSIAHCAEIRVFKIITFSLLSTTRAHFVTICLMICHIERVFLQMFVFHCIYSLIVEAEHCTITRLVHSVFLTLKFLHQRRWWRWRQISGMAFELLYLDLNSIVQQSAPNFPILQHCDALILSKVLFNTIHIG